jgi:hypothetical protein
MNLQERVVARRVRTGQRWGAGVGVGGGKPGSIARVWRTIDVDQSHDVEPVDRGQHDTTNEEDRHDGRSNEVCRRVVHEGQPPPENPVRGV